MHESAEPVVHAAHACPTAAHAVSDGVVHVVPSQQPFGHEVASHVHTPATQCSPAPQGPPVPQWQTPAEEQLSEATASQLTHVEPAAPHIASERELHVDPAQQPLGHDVASHTQRPPAQRCPSAHAGWPPHVHVPADEHASEVEAWHATHAAPLMPHAVSPVADWQVLPTQHPAHCPAQLEQAPAWQVSPVGHALHAAPPTPHAVGSVPAEQMAPSQHPVGHDVASQTHAPPEHRCPAPHAALLPHVHAPAALHESLVVWSHVEQVHSPDTHVRPGAHGGPFPQAAPGWL